VVSPTNNSIESQSCDVGKKQETLFSGVKGGILPTMFCPRLHYLTEQADRGFARSRLCTDEDGTTNNLVLYMVWNDTSKKGGDAPRATD